MHSLIPDLLTTFAWNTAGSDNMQDSKLVTYNAIQVQALRSVEKYLQLEKLYVLGTNCVDNGPREGLDKFLQAASSSPDTVLHYEFMQVHHCPLLTMCHMSGPSSR